jgi:rhamnosyltransferase subunit B
LVSFGSAGDLHPMLALGQGLRTRGHAVTLLSNPVFADAATAAGLQFAAVGDAQHQHDTVGHPKLWHPIDGFGVMWRYLLRPALAPTYEKLAELNAAGPCVVIASPVAMGARIAQEKLGLPLITAYTAATMLRSICDPMTLAQWRVPRWVSPRWRRSAWTWLDRHKLEPLVRPDLDALRARLDLPAMRASVFGQWMHSPQAGVTLFPRWFAHAASDWPRQVVQAGFPLYDDGPPQQLPEGLVEFLDRGPPPVVFMPGTARAAAADFFQAALRACEQTGQRGLLLGAVPHDLPLPSSVRAAGYLPFGWLLPRARALVHHGGIGSCAQALRAGIPQLVLPQGYDQFDNAMRLEHLGVGLGLPRGPRALQAMGSRLKELLDNPRVAASCTRWSGQTRPQPAQDTVAGLVERLQPVIPGLTRDASIAGQARNDHR